MEPRRKTRCVSVRSRLVAKLPDYPELPAPQTNSFFDLDYLLMGSMFRDLCAFANIFANFNDVHAERTAAFAFKVVSKNNPKIQYQIHLDSIKDRSQLKNVYTILEHLGAYIFSLAIVGNCEYTVTADDINLMKHVSVKCPNIKTFSLESIETDEIQMDYFKSFRGLTSIELSFSRLGQNVLNLPKITEFEAKILTYANCLNCIKMVASRKGNREEISHEKLIDFYTKNPQLKRVILRVCHIPSLSCIGDCKFVQRNFLTNVNNIFAKRPMEFFKISIKNRNSLKYPVLSL